MMNSFTWAQKKWRSVSNGQLLIIIVIYFFSALWFWLLGCFSWDLFTQHKASIISRSFRIGLEDLALHFEIIEIVVSMSPSTSYTLPRSTGTKRSILDTGRASD